MSWFPAVIAPIDHSEPSTTIPDGIGPEELTVLAVSDATELWLCRHTGGWFGGMVRTLHPDSELEILSIPNGFRLVINLVPD